MNDGERRVGAARIWWFAFGYFACYAPYSGLTKLISDGRLASSSGRLDGFAILPLSTMASLGGMLAFLGASNWWRYAGRRTVWRRSIPAPGRWTFLSGLATAAIIATTTLAYTFEGVSIVFMMLLMRGGVLVIAPIVDALAKRRVNASSWVALGLSLAALALTTRPSADSRMTWLAAGDVAAYLAGYFLRLRFMSRLAKSGDRTASIRYFVEEQMVASPVLLLGLAAGAMFSKSGIGELLRWGFVSVWTSPLLLPIAGIGLLSQGTGIFGGLVLLDARSNVFCVAVNRASSVLAGTLAAAGSWLLDVGAPLQHRELAGAGLLSLALAVLAWPPLRPRSARAASPG